MAETLFTIFVLIGITVFFVRVLVDLYEEIRKSWYEDFEY